MHLMAGLIFELINWFSIWIRYYVIRVRISWVALCN